MSSTRTRGAKPKNIDERKQLRDLTAVITEVQSMPIGQLAERYHEMIGEVPSGPGRNGLVGKICWKLQAQAEGLDLSASILDKLDEFGPKAPIRTRPPRGWAPPMAGVRRDPRIPEIRQTVVKVHHGVEQRVLILDEGFQWNVKTFRSLSGVAKAITGTAWN